METNNYQRWLCELKLDGMHPQTAPLSAVFHMKFWQNGGISGTKEKNKEEENLRFNLLSRSTNGIKNAGDVFGEWTSTGLSFTLVTRQQACKWEFQGKWGEKFTNVPEGRFKVTQDNFRMDTTVGTFKLAVNEKINEEKKSDQENTFIKNMKEYILNSPEERHFYDFKIVAADGSAVPCHKIILASQTEYFGALFRQENPEFVTLDFPSDIIRMCVRYLYTEDIDINGDNVQDIVVFANYVMIMDVVKVCEKFIIKNIDLSSCLDVLKLGDFIGNSVVVDESKKMICKNFQTIFSEDEEALKSMPINLFKQILSSDQLILYNEYNIVLPGDQREEKLAEFIEKYCLVNLIEKDREDLKNCLRGDKERKISSHRELSHLKTFLVSQKMGSAGDYPRNVENFNVRGDGKKFIRHISICTVLWDDRSIVGGLKFKWSDGSEDTVGTMSDEDTNNIIEMNVPEGEHVSYVFGNSGWYVDCLSFVTSTGKRLGSADPIGGDGGDFRNPLTLLDPKFNSFNTYLDGLEGDEVLSQNKKILARVRFIYSCLTNGEEPGDVTDHGIVEDEEEDLEEMWNMDEDITESSDDDSVIDD